MQQWRERRRARAENKLVEDTFAEAFGRPNIDQIRRWTDTELHTWLVGNDLHGVERSMAQRELERRKAWDAPAGRAFWISIAALVVSFAATLIALFKAG